MLIMVVLISGCNHQNNNMEESKKTSFSNEKTSDSTTKPSSIVSTAVPTTAIPTTLPTENHNKKEDAPVGYAEANYFKEKVSTLQERGKALEIKFAKQCYKIYTGGKSNDYKKVSINYQSWLYPLEGEDAKYFIPLPNRECTYEKLGDAKELLEYLEKCIE